MAEGGEAMRSHVEAVIVKLQRPRMPGREPMEPWLAHDQTRVMGRTNT